MAHSLLIVYASTAGHTEYVLTHLVRWLSEHAPDLSVTLKRAEPLAPEDLLAGDVLLLACGTWNTGSTEGQLNPYMHRLLIDKAESLDLQGKPCAVIGLGDSRYRYTARAADRLQHFVETHNGKMLLPLLRIVNEPYGQEGVVEEWGKALIAALEKMGDASGKM